MAKGRYSYALASEYQGPDYVGSGEGLARSWRTLNGDVAVIELDDQVLKRGKVVGEFASCWSAAGEPRCLALQEFHRHGVEWLSL